MKPKVGNSNILRPTPPHRQDIWDFPPHMVIAGPLKVYPVKGGNWEIPSYPRIKQVLALKMNLKYLSEDLGNVKVKTLCKLD